MERPELRLVVGEPARKRTLAAAGLGAAILAAAGLATVSGADAARRPFDPARIAETALSRSLADNDAEAVPAALATLRARLTSTPLDAASRTIAASLLAETAEDDAARSAAADQAVTATRLVHSDEWIARAAARVLARCGRADAALAEVARTFAYAPSAAALTLAEIEPFVTAEQLRRGLPERADALLAWSVELRQLGREDEADAQLALVLARWPDDQGARLAGAGVAAGRDRVADLARLVPASLAIPETPEAAPLFAYRARVKAEAADGEGARADAAHAIALRPGDPWVLVLAGDALVSIDAARARELWTRGLYDLEALHAPTDATIWIVFRLARLDDREGRGASALRNWRSIQALRPDSAEAKRRIEELTGRSPR